MHVEIDYGFAEGGAGQPGFVHKVRSFGEGRWQPRKFGINIRVAEIFLAAIKVFTNPSHACREHGREGQIGIGVRAGHSVFDAKGLTFADNAKADGAIVQSPGHAGGRPTSGLVTFVAVDGGSEEETEVWRVF